MALTKDFGFGPDELMVRDQARKFLRENFGVERLRKLVAADHHEAYESAVQPAPYDQEIWRQMVELGWTGLAVPESASGVGMKMIAVAALAEEIGRTALPSPLTATLIATTVLRAAGATTWLERVAAGEAATLAVTGTEGSWEPDETDVHAKPADGGIVLNGTAAFVQDARKASVFVVSAKGANGVALYAVPASAPGLTITPDRIVDLTRDQATLGFDEVAVPSDGTVAPSGRGTTVLEAATPAILTIVAADLCGAAEWQLQTTTEYARTRVQFDHPIGFFQAVKHPIVNMMMDVDRARSLTYAAACAIDTEPAEALRLARMAKAAASDGGAFASSRSIQLHGGIGFTWECDVQIWFKRAMFDRAFLGTPSVHRERAAKLAGW
ncbi:MAG: acyl-CoA dehydrogenase family protein [Candidatus Binatia bacterium]